MELTIKDISQLMMLPEKEVMNLIKLKEIPHQILIDKIVFNKQQIIEWALSRSMPLNLSENHKLREYHIESLSKLLDKNSFHYNCNFNESNYIEQSVSNIDLEKSIDKDIIIQLLKNRESLMSTAIGNGISLPHPRVPLMLGKSKPLINFFFVSNPLKLNSLDSKPVHTIILVISQTIKQHLSLIAHLGFLLSKETFRFAIEKRLEQKEILDIIKIIEMERK